MSPQPVCVCVCTECDDVSVAISVYTDNSGGEPVCISAVYVSVCAPY